MVKERLGKPALSYGAETCSASEVPHLKLSFRKHYIENIIWSPLILYVQIQHTSFRGPRKSFVDDLSQPSDCIHITTDKRLLKNTSCYTIKVFTKPNIKSP